MKNKITSYVLAIVIAMGMLAGCSQNNQEETKQKQNSVQIDTVSDTDDNVEESAVSSDNILNLNIETVQKNKHKFAINYNFAVGVKTDGTVLATGENNAGQCNVEDWKGIIAVDIGSAHTVGLRTNGSVVATGQNHSGQCNLSDWKDIIAIEANNEYTIGLKSDGTVISAGSHSFGKLDSDDWTDIVSISSDDSVLVGVKSDGTVVHAGNYSNAVGDIEDWKNIVSVSCYGYTVAMDSDGKFLFYGDIRNKSNVDNVNSDPNYTGVVDFDFNSKWGLKPDGTVISSSSETTDLNDIVAIYHKKIALKEDGTFILANEDTINVDVQNELSKWNLNAGDFIPTNDTYYNDGTIDELSKPFVVEEEDNDLKCLVVTDKLYHKDGQFGWYTEETFGEIYGYIGEHTSLILPSSYKDHEILLIKGSGDTIFTSKSGFYKNIKSVTIPDTVITIGHYAFCGCDLEEINFGSKVNKITDNAFSNCAKLTELKLPPNLKEIGENAFSSCHELKVIKIPDSVTMISENAFKLCDALTDVFYEGTEEEWNQIDSLQDCEELKNATIHYNSKID